MDDVYFEIELPNNNRKKELVKSSINKNFHIQEDFNLITGNLLLTILEGHERVKVNRDIINDLDSLKFDSTVVKNYQLPRFFFYNSSLKGKYLLLTSLLKINSKHNLPTNNLKAIMKNLELDNRVETFNQDYYEEIAKCEKIDDFQYNTFPDINLAISHIIDLEERGLRGILIDQSVCYRNNKKIHFKNNYTKNLEKIRKILNQEESEHSLSELMNLPYEEEKYYSHSLNKGMNICNLTGSMTDFSVSKFPEFNRKDINLLDDFDFHYIETIEDYYSPVVTIDGDDLILNKNFHFQGDIKKLEEISKKLFNKGYFISDIGMMRYIHENKIHRQDITFPDWFEVHNDIEFKKMLNFISLMVL